MFLAYFCSYTTAYFDCHVQTNVQKKALIYFYSVRFRYVGNYHIELQITGYSAILWTFSTLIIINPSFTRFIFCKSTQQTLTVERSLNIIRGSYVWNCLILRCKENVHSSKFKICYFNVECGANEIIKGLSLHFDFEVTLMFLLRYSIHVCCNLNLKFEEGQIIIIL